MKSKDSPSLYDVLKSSLEDNASRPDTVAPRPVTRVVTPPVAEEPPPPTPRMVVSATPPPAPPPAPEPSTPGERVLKLSINNAIFLGLIGLGLLFIAYAIGVRAGKGRAVEEAPATEKTSETGAAGEGDGTAAPGKIWAVRLIEWPAQKSEEYLKAMKNADALKEHLKRNGFPSAWYARVKRGDSLRVVLWWGRFEDRGASEAREKLTSLRQLKYRNEAVFSTASFEEIAP